MGQVVSIGGGAQRAEVLAESVLRILQARLGQGGVAQQLATAALVQQWQGVARGAA